jgi:hypothetical protein
VFHRRIELIDSCDGIVPRRQLQRVRRSVVQRLWNVAAGVLLSRRVGVEHRAAVSRWQIQSWRRRRVRQLQRGLCVSRRVDVVNASGGDVSCRHLQCSRRDGMQQLQCRLRVSCRLELVGACWGHVWRWHLQSTRRDIVQQLQRRLRVPRWLDVADACH